MNREDKKISVIIPVYNVEKYLRRCLESVINNTYKNLEIIGVNDGSPDNSLNILKEYAARDTRMVVLSKSNGGLSSARNKGIEESTGEYITFVDSDDWVHPQFFEILIQALQHDDTDVAICGFSQVEKYENTFIDYVNHEYKEKRWTISINELLNNKKYKMFKVYACGVLYKRNKIYSLFPEGVKVIEDNIFNLLNLPLYSKITIINIPIYFYYYNRESIMHTYSCTDAFKGLIWCCHFLAMNETLDKKVINEMVDFVYKRCLFYRYIFSLLKDKKSAKKSTRECYKILVSYDNHLSLDKRILYRIFITFPFLYYILKRIKSGKQDVDSFFSLAEGKLID